MTDLQIRPAQPDDAEPIKALAVAADMFALDEVAMFDPMLAGFFDGSLDGHKWIVAETADGEPIAGAAYYAPEPFADRMWNLYFIAVDPGTQGSGSGTALLEHIEGELRALGQSEARTLIVETSSTAKYERTQQFYASRGFVEEARIRQFYGPEDDKVVFWKSLVD